MWAQRILKSSYWTLLIKVLIKKGWSNVLARSLAGVNLYNSILYNPFSWIIFSFLKLQHDRDTKLKKNNIVFCTLKTIWQASWILLISLISVMCSRADAGCTWLPRGSQALSSGVAPPLCSATGVLRLLAPYHVLLPNPASGDGVAWLAGLREPMAREVCGLRGLAQHRCWCSATGITHHVEVVGREDGMLQCIHMAWKGDGGCVVHCNAFIQEGGGDYVICQKKKRKGGRSWLGGLTQCVSGPCCVAVGGGRKNPWCNMQLVQHLPGLVWSGQYVARGPMFPTHSEIGQPWCIGTFLYIVLYF